MKEISYKRKLLKELKQYKDEVGFDNEQNYSKLYNLCVDCDNEYGEPYLTDHIRESDLVDDDDVKYLMEKISMSHITHIILKTKIKKYIYTLK